MERSGKDQQDFGMAGTSRTTRGFSRFFETDLDRKDRITKVFQFFFPWVIFLIIAAITVIFLTLWQGWNIGKELLNIWIFYTLPPAGKESLIPKAVSSGVPGWIAGLSASSIDICVSLFLIWNYDWVKKLPVIGPALERTESKGRDKVSKTRWFGKATFLLTTFVVFVPFSGSGGVGGTVFGRVVGMSPYKVLLAVAIGSTIGSTGFALLSEQLAKTLGADNTIISFLSNLNILQFVAFLVTIGFLVYTIRNPKMAAMKTTKVVSQAFDISEKALDIAEDQRKRATDIAVRGTKESMKLMREGNRVLSDIGVGIATKPMDIAGRDGRRLKDGIRDFSRKQVDRAHDIADGAMDKTLKAGEKATSRSFQFTTSLTREGIKETRSGWEGAGKVLVKGGEKVEKLYPKKREGRSDDTRGEIPSR
jgi:hypothetical protein